MAISTCFKTKMQSPLTHLSNLRRPMSSEETAQHLSPSLHNASDTFIRHLKAVHVAEAKLRIPAFRDNSPSYAAFYEKVNSLAYHTTRDSFGAFEGFLHALQLRTVDQFHETLTDDKKHLKRRSEKLLSEGWPLDSKHFWGRVVASVKIVEEQARYENDNAKNDLGRPSDAFHSKTSAPEFSAPMLFDLRCSMVKAYKEVSAEMSRERELSRVQEEAQILADKADLRRTAQSTGLRDSLLQMRARIEQDDLVPDTEFGVRFTPSASYSTKQIGPAEVTLWGPLAKYLTTNKHGSMIWQLVNETIEKLKESEEYLSMRRREAFEEVRREYSVDLIGGEMGKLTTKIAQKRQYQYEDEESDFLSEAFRNLRTRRRNDCREMIQLLCEEDSDGIE